MKSSQPFTYLIGWSKHDRFYIGVKYANGCAPSDLWSTYFTSSQYVTAARYLWGEPDVFRCDIASSKDEALLREELLQFYFDAVKSHRFLNRGRGGHKFKRPLWGTPRPGNKGRKMTDEGRAKLKVAHNTPSARENHSKANSRPNTPEMREKAAATRARKKAEGWVNPLKGTKLSDERRAVLKEASANPDTRARRSAAMRKRHAERKARETALSTSAACGTPNQDGC
jgi:hypothetical protein